MESPEMGVMLIHILAMAWMLVGHLPQVDSGFVVLGLLLAMSFMPPLLVNAWEPALAAMNYNVRMLAVSAAMIVYLAAAASEALSLRLRIQKTGARAHGVRTSSALQSCST